MLRTAPPRSLIVLLMDEQCLPTPFETGLYDFQGGRHVVVVLNNGRAQVAVSDYDEDPWDNHSGFGCSGHSYLELYECVPARLKRPFPGHAVQSVTETGWRASKDGPLLSFAQDRFDVVVTVDRRLETQNDLGKFRLGFIIARVPNNRLDGFTAIFEQLNAAAARVRRGEIIHVVTPE